MTAALQGPTTAPAPRRPIVHVDPPSILTRRAALRELLRTDADHPIAATARIQIGEIGGSLLEAAGWQHIAPGNGVDHGLDLQIRIDGATVGEARIHFRRVGARLHGEMHEHVRAQGDAGRAMVWRAVAICARSLRLDSLLLETGAGPMQLSRREIRSFGGDAVRLESRRQSTGGRLHAMPQRLVKTVPTGVRLEPHGGISAARRAVDVIAASLALLVFAPFALVIALLVRRSSPGPVLFRQLRLGRGGQPFELLKFRTMDNSVGDDVHRSLTEASLLNGTDDTKSADDPRITNIGRFLRTWSLDEVPQFINVLRGEMTLVGPRPSLLWETSLFTPRTRRRLQMTPGLAGLWQASGRSELSMEEMLELDLEYADSASVGRDAWLLVKTAFAVVARRGAR